MRARVGARPEGPLPSPASGSRQLLRPTPHTSAPDPFRRRGRGAAQSEPRARARAYDSACHPGREETPPSRPAPAGLQSSDYSLGAENAGTRALSSHGGSR